MLFRSHWPVKVFIEPFCQLGIVVNRSVVGRIQVHDLDVDKAPRLDQEAQHLTGNGIAVRRIEIEVAATHQHIVRVGRFENNRPPGFKTRTV